MTQKATQTPALVQPPAAPTPPSTQTPISVATRQQQQARWIGNPSTATPSPAPAPAPAALTPSQLAAQVRKRVVDDEKRVENLKEVDPLLVHILSQPRKHDSPGEKRFHSWLIGQINKMGYQVELMAEDCIVVQVDHLARKAEFIDQPGSPGENPDWFENVRSKVLFSCHIDTVHWVTETEPYKICYDPSFNHIFLDTQPLPENAPKWETAKKSASCLGADDGVGVWIMLKMLAHKVPGTYIFHRGEEGGCVGSNAMLTKHRDWLKFFDMAIAFDRPKDFEVITHQGGMECCSKEFGLALAKALNDSGKDLSMEPSNRGVFTDTRIYRGVIPECTNLGVGYFDHHSKDEYLDYDHALRLKDACLLIDWESLPVKRDPVTAHVPQYQSSRGGWVGYQRPASPFPTSAPPAANQGKKGKKGNKQQTPPGKDYGSMLEMLYDTISGPDDLELLFTEAPEETCSAVFRAILEGYLAQRNLRIVLDKIAKE